MFDTEVQEYLATLSAYRDHQLGGASGTAMHRAVSASIKLLERESAVQRLIKAVVQNCGKELDELVSAVAKKTP